MVLAFNPQFITLQDHPEPGGFEGDVEGLVR